MSRRRKVGRVKKLKICPRCGKHYSYVEKRRVGDNTYFYAVHVKVKAGKRRIKKCYLGPDTYAYVSKMHQKEMMMFRGLVAENRIVEYLESILAYLESVKLTERQACEIADMLEEAARKLRERYS